MKRIGIFQYGWPLQIHALNLASSLAEEGFIVDLFLYDCDLSYVNLSKLQNNSNVNVIFCERKEIYKSVENVIYKILCLFGLSDSPPVWGSVVKYSSKYIRDSKYDYFIGIEKKGLLWAGRLLKKFGVPYLYYSLELFVEGHPVFDGKREFIAVRREERKYHTDAIGTIIQDKLRAEVLLKSNGIITTDIIYLPVSVTGDIIREKNYFIHDRFNIDRSKKIIFYFGLICENRGVHELVNIAENLGDDFVMVLHGPAAGYLISPELCNNKLYLSTDLVDADKITRMLSSAHIGMAFYDNEITNARLTAFSSEKIALYMQAGLPIVAYSNESYELLMDNYRCGELVDHIHDVPEAVRKIDAYYLRYRENAFSAFNKYYSFNNNVTALHKYLSKYVAAQDNSVNLQ